MFRKEIRELIWAFFLVSLGGLLLHLRIHPPAQSLFNWIPCAFGLMGTFVLPVLFNRRETVAYAYLLTWAAVCRPEKWAPFGYSIGWVALLQVPWNVTFGVD